MCVCVCVCLYCSIKYLDMMAINIFGGVSVEMIHRVMIWVHLLNDWMSCLNIPEEKEEGEEGKVNAMPLLERCSQNSSLK